MDLKLLVETGESCGFKITDLTDTENNGYLPEMDEFTPDRFKYKDTSVICVLGLQTTHNLFPKYEDFIYAEHNSDTNYVYIPTKFDGRFTLSYIVLPNKKWFEENKEAHTKDYPNGMYFSDKNKIYKYDELAKDLYVEVEEKEIIELLNGLDDEQSLNELKQTTLTIFQNEYVSICYLKKCFINLCKLIFEKRIFDKCAYRNKIDSQLIYNRDLVWMAINVISYLTEFGQLYEAQRIIELITNCNGICKQYYRESNIQGCGCS